MNWLNRLLDAARNPDVFWEQWQRERREARLTFHRKERTRLLDRVASSERMIAYYANKLRRDDIGSVKP